MSPASNYSKKYLLLSWLIKKFLAITKGNVEIIKLLLDKSTINKNNVKGHVLLVHDEGEMSPAFDRKYDYNDGCVNWAKMKEQTEQKTPFYLAVESKNIQICKVLLSNADININLHSKYFMIKKIDNRKEEEIEKDNDDNNNYYRNNYEEEEEEEKEEEEKEDYNYDEVKISKEHLCI